MVEDLGDHAECIANKVRIISREVQSKDKVMGRDRGRVLQNRFGALVMKFM